MKKEIDMKFPQDDMAELRRMVTNLYDDDKACILRIIRGITNLEIEISRLNREVSTLQKAAKPVE